jgi:uncharacterized phiE125 gp8 family phage protein
MFVRRIEVRQEPVSVEELKAHLKLEHSEEDGYLGHLLSSAREAIESFLQASVALQVWEARYTRVAGSLCLPMPPVRGIELITVDGNEVVSGYNLLTPRVVYFSTPLVSSLPDGVAVRYVAGYASTPSPLKHAVLVYAAYLYESRLGEAPEVRYQVQVTQGVLPPAVLHLLSGYRVHRL